MQLCVPLSDRADAPPKIDAKSGTGTVHFLSNLLQRCVRQYMRSTDTAVRLEAEYTFRDIVATIELDYRYPIAEYIV